MQSVPQPIKSASVAQQVRHSHSTRLVCGIILLLIYLLSWSFVRDLWYLSDYQSLASHCAGIAPISSLEYHTRQTNLAKTLHALNASAYIAEPSANTQFFTNFSTAEWFLSERPLLLILAPSFDPVDGDVEPKITILTPKVKNLLSMTCTLDDY